jgi:Sec-independent protein translocase protein TatA
MLSLSHLVIIIIGALIFLGPDKIPEFLKSCAEGIIGFKKIINKSDEEENFNKKNHKKKKFTNNRNCQFKNQKNFKPNKKPNPNKKPKPKI